MAELCLVASHGYPPGLVLNQELDVSRVFKDCQSFPANSGRWQEIAGARNLSLISMQSHIREQREPLSGLLESNDRAINKSIIMDVHNCCPTSDLFTFRVSQKPVEHGEIQHISGLYGPDRVIEDVPLLASSVDLQAITHEVLTQQVLSSVIDLNGELYSQQPLVDFVGDMARDSKITIHHDGQVEFSGSRMEMKHLLSIIAKSYLLRNSMSWSVQSSLVPQYNWLNVNGAQTDTMRPYLKLEAATVPSKSHEKVETKQFTQKKSRRKARKERDMYKRNSFHACESLLSLLMDKKTKGKSTILSLKKAGPELPELLNHFSAGIAGAGIAVLFSVICKLACARVSFCSSRLLSTGLGFGLVWLSWAVNKLGSTVMNITRGAGKLGELKEKEMLERINKSANEIYFSATTLMAVAVLRFV
ncbi:hypothetical protein SAY86_027647 [Trapa natans]|uniref:Uncharacterized protein n=1 Tax=Trapa natans TaxID=22666 RepID=A0AAN7KMQ7_TRANT|nr:hypothetical protein SAY86_027647 [Trapa natans]